MNHNNFNNIDPMMNLGVRNIFRKIRAGRYEYDHLVEVIIDKEALFHNFYCYQKNIDDKVRVVPVLKSNAYGHGLIETAKILVKAKPEFVIVDSYYEALVLRNEGIKIPILIIGFSSVNNIGRNSLENVSFEIADMEWLKEMNSKLVGPRKFHLKIDTGMNRQGVEIEDLEEVIKLIMKNKNIVLEGIFSHLAEADSVDQKFTLKQIEKWNRVVKKIRKVFPNLQYWHLGASASIHYQEKIIANVMRLGLGMYGIESDAKMKLGLKPVMEVRTIITSIRKVKKGEKIGYGLTYKADREMKVATIPMGYFEGVDRRLSNKGWVKIGDKFCPMVGRVSMNITSVDVSGIEDLKLGEVVIMISANKNDKNSVENIARECGTIPYEILVHVERKLRRKLRIKI